VKKELKTMNKAVEGMHKIVEELRKIQTKHTLKFKKGFSKKSRASTAVKGR